MFGDGTLQEEDEGKEGVQVVWNERKIELPLKKILEGCCCTAKKEQVVRAIFIVFVAKNTLVWLKEKIRKPSLEHLHCINPFMNQGPHEELDLHWDASFPDTE